jgi:hypothetical protein
MIGSIGEVSLAELCAATASWWLSGPLFGSGALVSGFDATVRSGIHSIRLSGPGSRFRFSIPGCRLDIVDVSSEWVLQGMKLISDQGAARFIPS